MFIPICPLKIVTNLFIFFVQIGGLEAEEIFCLSFLWQARICVGDVKFTLCRLPCRYWAGGRLTGGPETLKSSGLAYREL